jgi:hypothetical protein
MLGLSYAQEVVILAGACSGVTLGVFLTTRIEGKKRGINLVVNPFERVSLIESVRVIALPVAALLIVGSLVVLVGLGILRLGGVYRLTDGLNHPFAIAFLIGAGAGKLFRYVFWRSR